MSGLNLMRSSLALCYFYSLPTSITDYLFSVEFLEKLDNELKNCYAKVMVIHYIPTHFNLNYINHFIILLDHISYKTKRTINDIK